MTKFDVKFSDQAKAHLGELKTIKSKQAQYKAVMKTLARMEQNLRHPSLNTHKHTYLSKIKGYEVFESYAQNNTSGAYRIFWRYGPNRSEIIVTSITLILRGCS